MITVQGVAVNSKNAEAPITTKGDPFYPLAVNVSGQKDKPEWQTLRVYAKGAADLETLRAHVAEKKSLIVRSISNLFTRTFEKDGQVRATASFSTNLRQVEAFDNDAKAWKPLAALLGIEEAAKAA